MSLHHVVLLLVVFALVGSFLYALYFSQVQLDEVVLIAHLDVSHLYLYTE